MAVNLEIRNPYDRDVAYDQIEIQRNTVNSETGMTNIKIDLAIDTTRITDISQGFSSYVNTDGVHGTHFYRYRYKINSSSVYSPYSEIFPAEGNILFPKFRNRMKDTNSANYYFTDSNIKSLSENAIKKLFPHSYLEVIDESISTDSTLRKYNFPSGVNRVNDIEFLDSSGDVQIYPRRWKLRSRQIIFDSSPPDNYTMRLYADKMFQKFAEIPEFLDDLILDLMTLDAYQTLHAHRTSFYKYTTTTNPEGGNLPSITEMMKVLAISTKDRLNSIRRVRRASSIKLVN